MQDQGQDQGQGLEQDQDKLEAQEARLLAALQRIEAAGLAGADAGEAAKATEALRVDLSAARSEITTLKERLAQAQAASQAAADTSSLEAEVTRLKGDLEGAEAGHAETVSALQDELQAARAAAAAPAQTQSGATLSGDAAAALIAELRTAAQTGVADADLINRAVLAELDALRQARAEDLAELQALLAELDPVLEESAHA